MKKVLDWVKAHMLIVIFGAITLIVLPAGFVASMMWNGSIRTTAQTEFDDTKRQLDGQTKVSYALPAVLEGESSDSDSRPPNRAVTRFYAEQKERRIDQVRRVVDQAVERNRNGHEPVIEGLFPRPESDSELVRLRMSKELLRTLRGGPRTASAYNELLSAVNAGEPIDPGTLDAQLSEFASQEREKLELSADEGRLSPEQDEQLTERVRERRLALVAGRAREISTYADLDAVRPTQGSRGGSTLPLSDPEQISAAEAFTWQWDYWVVEKVLGVIRAANTDAREIPTDVADSPVKRIDSIVVKEATLAATNAGADDGGSFRGRGAPAGPVSSGDWPAAYQAKTSNELYDVRMVRMELTVATRKLPLLLEAFEREGLMRVVDLDVRALDAEAELAAGYYFGTDHVSSATLVVETVWLREWTKAYMPPAVRTALGIPADEPVTDSEPTDEP